MQLRKSIVIADLGKCFNNLLNRVVVLEVR